MVRSPRTPTPAQGPRLAPYHILHRNCNHFAELLVRRLLGDQAEVPGWVNRAARVGDFLLPALPLRSAPRAASSWIIWMWVSPGTGCLSAKRTPGWLAVCPGQEVVQSHVCRLLRGSFRCMSPRPQETLQGCHLHLGQ